MTTDSGHDYMPFRTTVVECHKRCGRHLVVKYPDVAKIDTDWLCPICDQDEKDKRLTEMLNQPRVPAPWHHRLDPSPLDAMSESLFLAKCEHALEQARVLYEETLAVQRESVRLKALLRQHGIIDFSESR